ncbi:hypothetical protein [Paracoccus sp. (in: a-proteobacteria)]|uniref:hypothetical protein n=1 Tax=Paracoccus sp. TaxID=267 RepID=UPI00396C7674
MTRYAYRITKRTDGSLLHQGIILDQSAWGITKMRQEVRRVFLDPRLEAEGLTVDDLEVEMKEV